MTRRPLRVLYLIGGLGMGGGSENHLARLLLGLDRSRALPFLVCFRNFGDLLEVVRNQGVPIHDLEVRGGRMAPVRRFKRLRRVIREIAPDVVHAYGYPADLYLSLAGLLRRRMRVVTSRRGNSSDRLVHLLYRLTNPLVDRVVCVSAATRDHAMRTEGLREDRSCVIPNGVELGPYEQGERGSGPIRTIGALGRLRHIKGPDLLIEAFERLRHPDSRLVLGGPTYGPWGEALVEAHRGKPGIEFRGPVSDVPAFLRSIDLFVLPSRSEGMSNALLEAMASGLPIVATDVGSNREVLEGGRAGILVEPDAASLAAGIASLLDDPERAWRLGATARERARREYALQPMIRRYEALYESLVFQGVAPSVGAHRAAGSA